MSSKHTADIDHLVVIPDDPADIVPLAAIDRPRGDVDQALDEMFGEVDDEGPGATDAFLLAGGAVAVIAAQIAALPAVVLVGGLAGLGLGSVLPIRSGFRRLQAKRRMGRMTALIGQGHLLDTQHPVARELVTVHRQAFAAAELMSAPERLRTRSAAHALVVEVATLLDGHRPTTDAEVGYANERLATLRTLAAVANDTRGERGPNERRAQVHARETVESLAGDSAIHQAEQLIDDLGCHPDA